MSKTLLLTKQSRNLAEPKLAAEVVAYYPEQRECSPVRVKKAVVRRERFATEVEGSSPRENTADWLQQTADLYLDNMVDINIERHLYVLRRYSTILLNALGYVSY